MTGEVFNVSRYMDFHPGGIPELMRGVGKDATKLFDEVMNYGLIQSNNNFSFSPILYFFERFNSCNIILTITSIQDLCSEFVQFERLVILKIK